jgi:hypothetical protein
MIPCGQDDLDALDFATAIMVFRRSRFRVDAVGMLSSAVAVALADRWHAHPRMRHVATAVPGERTTKKERLAKHIKRYLPHDNPWSILDQSTRTWTDDDREALTRTFRSGSVATVVYEIGMHGIVAGKRQY